jgi:hypothetical protein
LKNLGYALNLGSVGDGEANPAPPPPPPPGGGGGFGKKLPFGSPSPSPAAAAAPAAQSSNQGVPYWDPFLGDEEQDEEDAMVSRAASSQFQFRGVFGTYQHDHGAAVPVLPTFRVGAGDTEAGRPGRKDSVLLVDRDPEDLGWPGVIHHAWRPVEHLIYAWDETAPLKPVAIPTVTSEPEDAELLGFFFVALEEPFPVPIAPDPELPPALAYETRVQPRMLKYPSGERPRLAERLVVGGDLRGSPPPAVVIDELAFGSIGLGAGAIGIGMETDLGIGAQGARMPSGIYTSGEEILAGLPAAGLLRLGSEILCYQGYDSASGQFELATDGRGLLGTVEESHPNGAMVAYLEDLIVTTLSADVSAASAALPILDSAGFPSEGTVLVDDELVHYTRLRQGALEMPSASTVPGAMDGKGGGLFRGRYGTEPAGHRQGAPVILFPFRYWDRQAEHADAPELAYFGMAVDQPGAFWRSVFWDADEVEGSEIYALQREVDLGRGSAPPWDGDPTRVAGLTLYDTGMHEGEGIPIGRQADRLEWRFFVRYLPGAFDALNGLSHAWKRTPRLEVFGVESLAPNQILWRLDQ